MSNEKLDTNWYLDDSFWVEMKSFLFSDERQVDTVSETNGLLKLVEANSNTVFIDLGCGTGRHVHELSRRGYQVHGVDHCVDYLNDAKALANEEGLSCTFSKQDLREDLGTNTFDVAISFFSSFGYFEDSKDDVVMLERVYEALACNGMLVMELTTKELLTSNFESSSVHFTKDDKEIIERRKILDNGNIMENHWTIYNQDKRTTHVNRLRLLSISELTFILEKVGFDQIDFYSSLDQKPFQTGDLELFIVAKKK